MIVAAKDILLNSNSIITLIVFIFIYVILIAAIIYGSRKHYITDIIKSPSIFIFLFTVLIESIYYIFIKYFTDIPLINERIIFSAEAVIFIIGVIISLIDEKYYANTFPVTICRIAICIVGISILLLIIEFVYIVFIILGSILLIMVAVWSAVDFQTFKKNILFWRNRT